MLRTVSRHACTLICAFGALSAVAASGHQDTPNMSDYHELSIEALAELQQQGVVRAVDLVDYFLQRISTLEHGENGLNAIAHLTSDARSQAEKLDVERQEQGPRSLLHGIPIVVKDNYETLGTPTTVGSATFAGFAPQRDATLVRRLRDAGAVLLGKTTMHEFAYGITTVGSAFGATRNPYHLDRNPGGSSGGTGAAVAAGYATAGMGSDTCGSIRIPAAQNNLVGLRGTQGLSSRHGIVPLSSTQDIGGPITRSVRDLAIMLDATVGYDAADLQTAASVGRVPTSYLDGLHAMPEVKLGLLTDWLIQDPEDAAVAGVIRKTLAQMSARRGWEIVELASEAVNTALDRAWNGHLVLIYDFHQDINRYLAANPELGMADLKALVDRNAHHPNVNDSLLASLGMGSAARSEYLQELAQREIVRNNLLALMAESGVDALVYPTIRRVAARLGEEQMGTNCRLAANSGLPALSVPAGFDDQGLPVGIEFLAEPFSEQKLLNIGLELERAYPQRRAPRFLGTSHQP